MLDKWNNVITTITTLFTHSQNEYFNNTFSRSKSFLFRIKIHEIFYFSFRVLLYQNHNYLQLDWNLKKNFLLVIIHLNLLFSRFNLVLSYLQFVISSYNQTDILNKIFSCLSKWLEFGISILQIESFFDYLFNSLNHENLFHEVSDCRW
jgi:hypothetical protein